jgi:DNA polymerase-3 subunit gamma/tau
VSYQSLYRRYRPRRFGEVRGQDHLVAALQNAVRDDRVGHAYLLSGPRGTGKTTTARILAKVLNCEAVRDGEPCLECASCLAIESGGSFDLHELDAASNRGINEMRALLESTALGSPGHRRVYILDEVHQLTKEAEAALLKTLEEPPDHVVFVLATTDPHKVGPTIRSRTQHFELHLIPADELDGLVRHVIADAGLTVDDDAIAHVLRAGGGSARDTLSALDQVVAAGGVDDRQASAEEVLAALLQRDPGGVLVAVDGAVATGREPRVLGEALVTRLRDVFLASLGVPLDHLPDVDRTRVAELVDGVDRPFLTRALDCLGTALVEMRQAADPRITLETALVRLADATADTSVAALLERIERLERQLAGGAVPVAPATAPAEAPPTTAPAAAAPGPTAALAPAAPRPAGGVADEARRKLADRAAATRSAPAPSPPPAPPTPPVAAAAAAAAPTPAPTPIPTPTPAPAPAASSGSASGVTPDAVKDALVDLPKLTRARFAGGRVVAVDGDVVTFGFPNEHHLKRCQEDKPAVEAVLAARFGGAVTLRLVIESAGAAAPDDERPHADPVEAAPEEDVIDVHDLVDAPSEPVRSGADKLVEAFPGAELVEDER